jgi:uncharacterized protein DUF5678
MTILKTDEGVRPEDAASLDEDMKRLRGFLEREDVEGARAFVKELETKWPDSPRVQHFVRVLAPPVVKMGGPTSRSMERERAWLRAHPHEYPGCWIALYGDRVVAADPDLGVVLATVRSTPDCEDVLLHRQPGAPEQK